MIFFRIRHEVVELVFSILLCNDIIRCEADGSEKSSEGIVAL